MNDFVNKVSQKITKLSSEQIERLINDLKTDNDMLACIVESLSTGLVIVDSSWHIKLCNKAAERYLPFKMRPMEQKNDGLAVWKLVDDEKISSFLCSCDTDKKTNITEEFSISSTDSVRFITVAVMPLVERYGKENADGIHTRIVGSIISVDDITEKRQQEILLHRMESLASLTNLAASVAHEIKNPLGAISIHIQLIQKAIKKSRDNDNVLPNAKFMENYLDVITEEIDNLNKIVVDFLFAVRPLQATMALCEPNSIIDKIANFLKPEFDSKNIDIKLFLCKETQSLLLDEKLFREIIINIAQNAVFAIQEKFSNNLRLQKDYNDGQYQKGELSICSIIKSGKYILTIADNGCGMDSKTASRIFEPYYTTKASGTGLGLTMVYKIVKEFNGSIDVKSVPMKGTMFTIKLPIPQKGTRLLEDKTKGKK